VERRQRRIDGVVEVDGSPEVVEDDSVNLSRIVAYHTMPRCTVDAARVGGRVPPEGPCRLVTVAPPPPSRERAGT
jgi:hypothetical protein